MEGQVRIGTVSQISGRQVRVHFPDKDIISGWLTVTKHRPSVAAKVGEETASVTVAEWMPAVGDTVLCLYADGFNADGYVIGGL